MEYSTVIREYHQLYEYSDSVSAEHYLNAINLTERQKDIVRKNHDRPALINNDVFDLADEWRKIERQVKQER